MELTDPPLPPEIWAATPCAAQALILATHPGLTPFPVKTILHSTAWNVRNPAPDSASTESRR